MDSLPPKRSNTTLNLSLAVLIGVLMVVALRLVLTRPETPGPAPMAPVTIVGPGGPVETAPPGIPPPAAAAALAEAARAAQDAPPPPPPPPEEPLQTDPSVDIGPLLDAPPPQPDAPSE